MVERSAVGTKGKIFRSIRTVPRITDWLEVRVLPGEPEESQMRKLFTKMFGDCSHCGHSVIYHLIGVGCMKCNCDEFH